MSIDFNDQLITVASMCVSVSSDLILAMNETTNLVCSHVGLFT